jgi:hypothetical protein
VRVVRSFSLSIVVDARIKELARQRGLSCSKIVEDLVGGIDYAEIFAMFDEARSFSEIVRATNLPPMLVREVYADYTAGLVVPPMTDPVTQREHERGKRAETLRDVEREKTERARVNTAARERIAELEATVRQREADVVSLQSQLEATSQQGQRARKHA